MSWRETRTVPRDRADMRHLPCAGGLDVMEANFWAYSFARHFHDTFALVLVGQGVDEFLCGREVFRALPGEVAVFNPGEVHTGHRAGAVPLRYRSLYPAPELLQEVARDLGRPDVPVFRPGPPVVRDPAVAARFRRLFDALDGPGDPLAVETLLLGALSGLVCHFDRSAADARPPGGEPGAVRRVREYLRAHATQNLTLGALAGVAGLSRFHLLRVFHHQVGLPPHQYQLLVRVEQAKSLLRKGTPIAEAAYEAGFSDQSHLTRCFKRFLGVTPGRYGREQ
jgi:AraC-like DNA-binding protein